MYVYIYVHSYIHAMYIEKIPCPGTKKDFSSKRVTRTYGHMLIHSHHHLQKQMAIDHNSKA